MPFIRLPTLALIAFIAGIYALQQQASLPPMPGVLVPTSCAAVALAAWLSMTSAGHTRRGLCAIALCVATAAGLGYYYAASRAHIRLFETLAPEYTSEDLVVIGVIEGLPQTHARGVRFDFRIEATLDALDGTRKIPYGIPAQVQLTWYHSAATTTRIAQPAPTLQSGERWRFAIRLKPPLGTVNRHGMDFELWALERGIRAIGYVRPASSAPQVLLDELAADAVMARVHRLRARLAERIRVSLADGPYAGVLIALTVGDQSAIARDQWRIFWRTGVGHLMSISGLHVTMLAALAALAMATVWRHLPRAALYLPVTKAASLAALACAFSYALIAGYAVPTQRTVYMIAGVTLALWSDRRLPMSRTLLLAAAGVLVIDPWAVMATGFWLSFAAVGVMVYAAAWRQQQDSALIGAVRAQMGITILMAPLGLVLFQEVSLVGPLANAFAIPTVSMVVVPMALLGAFIDSPWPLFVAHGVMDLIMVPLQALADWPHATWQNHAPPAWTVAIALGAGAVLLLPRAIPYRWLVAPCFLPLFLLRPAPPEWGTARIDVLDVGQGLAIVIRTASRVVIYDTGASFLGGADMGQRVVIPFLRGEGMREVDTLIVSHDDDDHIGGAASVIEQRLPTRLRTSLADPHPLVTLARARGLSHHPCLAGQHWHWEGVHFEFLHPDLQSHNALRGRRHDNDRSCVLRVTTAGASLLLTGDIEAPTERALVARYGHALATDILLVPHHGSKTSSTDAFLAHVRPQQAVMSVGAANRFRHPHRDVLARYAQYRIPITRTDQGGALRFLLPTTPAPITITELRQLSPRYWRTRISTASQTQPAP
jgi:competence protein ComEC